MPNLMVAVGGTGQHIALACSRLMRLGAIKKDELRAFVIDADTESELPQKLKNFKLMPGADAITPPMLQQPRTLFQNVVLGDNPRPAEQQIFECLFDNELAQKDVGHGMYGRPSISSTVFSKTGGNIGNLEASIGNSDKVVIAGSFIGGTGAGITHQLVKFIKERFHDKPVFGVFLQPWLELGGNAEVRNDTLIRNMRHGMEYFLENTARLFDRTTLLGIPLNAPDWLKEVKPQGEGESKHILHLLAGYSIVHLPLFAAENQKGQIYTFGIDENSQKGLYNLDFQDRPLSFWVQQSQYVSELLKHVVSENTKKNVKDSFGTFNRLFGLGNNFARILADMIKKYAEKCQRLKPETYFWELCDVIEGTTLVQFEDSFQWVSGLVGPTPVHQAVENVKQFNNTVELLESIFRDMPTPEREIPPQEFADIIEGKLREAFLRV